MDGCEWVKDFGSWEQGYKVAVTIMTQKMKYEANMPFVLICMDIKRTDFTEDELAKNLIVNDNTFAKWISGCLDGQMALMLWARYNENKVPTEDQFRPGHPAYGQGYVDAEREGPYSYPPSRYAFNTIRAFSEGARVGISAARGVDMINEQGRAVRRFYNFKCAWGPSNFKKPANNQLAQDASLTVPSDASPKVVSADFLQDWERGCDAGFARVWGKIKPAVEYLKPLENIPRDRVPFAIYPWADKIEDKAP
jgi:hypothetical protein